MGGKLGRVTIRVAHVMWNGDYSIDFAYRDNVISFFRSKGFIVQIHESSGRPDDDFVYMCSARNFVRGGGGYSKLVSAVVTYNGGRSFEPRKFSDVTFQYNLSTSRK